MSFDYTRFGCSAPTPRSTLNLDLGTTQKAAPTGGLRVAFRLRLISRGQYLGLQKLHRLAAALDPTVTGLDAEHLGVAHIALESLA
jgi:hypothetical protein